MSRNLAPWLSLAGVIAGAHLAAASPAPRHLRVDHRPSTTGQLTAAWCTGPGARCLTHVSVDAEGVPLVSPTPNGWGAVDLERAYLIPNVGSRATIAIVIWYGYANVESDLAVYRSQYGLPPCTVASGCLVIANQHGKTSPLPGPAPAGQQDTSLEQMLDLEMASAACQTCRLVLIQADDGTSNSLLAAQNAAASFRPAVISNSWGVPEADWDVPADEPYFAHAGIATFASSGDSGNNDGGIGPVYPSTSANVIAVGGTVLTSAPNARGWSESAWPSAGSSCSNAVAKPSWQAASTCPRRQAADISAVAQNVAEYLSSQGGWINVHGTSIGAPLVAGMFAAVGLGNVTNADMPRVPYINDIVDGVNGPCGNSLCIAGTGWDGPTGYGTPNIGVLLQGDDVGTLLAITYPQDGQTLTADQLGVAAIDINATLLEVGIDGQPLGSGTEPPLFSVALSDSTLAAGQHELELAATGSDGKVVTASVMFQLLGSDSGSEGSGIDGSAGSASGAFPAPGTDPFGDTIGGCAASGGTSGGATALAFALALVAGARRRRVERADQAPRT